MDSGFHCLYSDSKNGWIPIIASGVNHYLYILFSRYTFSIADFAVKVRLSIVSVRFMTECTFLSKTNKA